MIGKLLMDFYSPSHLRTLAMDLIRFKSTFASKGMRQEQRKKRFVNTVRCFPTIRTQHETDISSEQKDAFA